MLLPLLINAIIILSRMPYNILCSTINQQNNDLSNIGSQSAGTDQTNNINKETSDDKNKRYELKTNQKSQAFDKCALTCLQNENQTDYLADDSIMGLFQTSEFVQKLIFDLYENLLDEINNKNYILGSNLDLQNPLLNINHDNEEKKQIYDETQKFFEQQI